LSGLERQPHAAALGSWTTAQNLLHVAAADLFAPYESKKDVTRYVTILAKWPGKSPRLPITEPASNQWQVKFIAHFGRFLCSWHRREGKRLIYPNEVVEKHLKVEATTRNWNTIEAVCGILKRL
jgi:hypothetical protein